MKPLVFLHGWAQSRQIWCQQFDCFPDALFLNLPGHASGNPTDNQTDQINPIKQTDITTEHWLEHIHAQLPEECTLIGWSLGGMLALQLAQQFPQRIKALALISSTPCFRQQHDWPAGCDESLFAAFEQALASQSPRLLNRFFTLMLHGDDLSRADYNALAKQAVDREHPASRNGLQQGLELLASLDTRTNIQQINIPTLLLHGQEDAIVSAESTHWLASNIENSQKYLFPHCGHAPFLTQPQRFNTILKDWWISL